jgi:hypothetical protein
MTLSNVLKAVAAVGSVVGAIVMAAPLGVGGMIAAGSVAIAGQAATLHMEKPKYSSKNQKLGTDEEDPK